jgi:4-deoxy-L-threo-5-hexosulose-uronate ketol-isomerase
MTMTKQNTIQRMPQPEAVSRMTTEELRAAFLVTGLMTPGQIKLQFTDLDRFVVGGAVPTSTALKLENSKETGRAFFLERRELGAINTGGAGTVTVDGQTYTIEPEGCIYVGMGAKDVSFASADAQSPAKYFILSCPAHVANPTTAATTKDANTVPLGSQEQANKRVIRQYIHENGIKSCQLVMGYTELAEGSVWNTFPPHTHNRRTEVYSYWQLGERVLVHFLGEPHATRHLFVHEGDAVLSPSWSIHAGCGQGNYKFIWGMAGENQRFDDMDGIKPQDLR